MRTGLIAKKIGMSNYYTPNGINIPVTVLHIESCKVVERISDEILM
jgi:large subunit ribosomal protein L3